MNYIYAIKTAIILFPVIAFIITIPFILHEYHKYGSIHHFRALMIYSFILYLLVIYFLVILPLPTIEETINNTGPHFNFTPFKFVEEFITETSLVITKPNTYLKALTEPCFYVVIFNILMTIPFGMYLRYFFKCSFKKTIIYTFLLSLFFELTQGTGLYYIYPNPYRLCDIDDLIQNTLGGALGYFLIGLIIKYLPSRDEIDNEARKNSIIVSGLRRLTIFFLDLVLYVFLSLFLTIFIKKESFLIMFSIYYLMIPIILNNSTIGMRFLNVKMDYKKYNILKNILRSIFLLVYYFLFPILSMACISLVINGFHLEDFKLYFYLGVAIFFVFFYIIHILIILFKGEIYYDHLLNFKYISTYKIEKE